MKTYRNAAIAGGVGFIVAVFMGALQAVNSAHGEPNTMPWLPGFEGMVFGGVLFLIMEGLSRNRKMKTGDRNAKAESLRFEPLPDRAVLYLYRQGFAGRAAGLDVAIDESPVCQLKAPQFTVVVLDPGEHVVTVGFPKSAMNPKPKTWSHALNVRAGEIVALRFSPKMGLTEGSILITPEPNLAKAKAACARAKMILAEASA